MTKYFKHKIKIIQEKSGKNLIFRNGILCYRMLSMSYIFILDIFSIKVNLLIHIAKTLKPGLHESRAEFLAT